MVVELNSGILIPYKEHDLPGPILVPKMGVGMC